MASSSSSSRTCEAKYHVFLSFRGEDTRNNFIGFLYRDLHDRKGVETFIDCYDVKQGEKISESLLKAIEESKIAITVFSKDYASSTWCLEELTQIIDCEKSRGLIVLPVFYHVDPSDVRKQSGTFGEVFAKHEKSFKDESGKVQKWRSAFTEAGKRSGFHITATSSEVELVEEIVSRVLEILNHGSTINNNHLVGVESRIKEIKNLLDLESDHVFTIGICGMGGMGKTALASAVFEEIKSKFHKIYFQANVTEESQKIGLRKMCDKFVKKVLEDKGADLKSTLTKTRLRNKKILLVLDDVTRLHEDELITDLIQSFGSGSRIIITSREKQAIQYFGVNENKIYDIQPLQDNQSIVLFSRYAFRTKYPAEGYEELSKKIVRDTIVKGVPLALKVFGSMLVGMSKIEWESAMDKLNRNFNENIMDVLKLSYDRLSPDEQNIFIDVACFYNGFSLTYLKEILKDNGFNSELGLRQLIKKSLITVESGDLISMHDLLQEMGRNIGKSSRLQSHEDIDHVLRNNMGSPEIQIIQWDISKISQKIKLEPDTFLKMPNLRSIYFFPSPNTSFWRQWVRRLWLPYEESEKEVLTCEDLDFVCGRLRWLRWFKYPLKSLHSRFDPRNLVVLIMHCSRIEQLGNDDQHFLKLKHIDLSHSKHLTKIEHLSPCLETLILEGGSSLTELPTSLQSQSLRTIILSGTAIEKLLFIESWGLHNLELENC